jgi:hypothetical protein
VRFKVSAAAIAATMPSQVARADSGNRAGGVKSTTGAEPSRDQSLGIKQGCLPVVTVKRMPVSGSKTWQVGEPNMTPSSVFRSSIIISVLVAGLSLSANAETVGVMGNVATTDGSFTIAQTNGMDRRQDRRDTRQDCRQQEGAVGSDKRNCKQSGRQGGGG